MVDGVMLLVDACEGPLPQTRFVLRKALEANLAPIVVITKIDRADARPAEVLHEIHSQFVDLDATAEQLRFPVLYCNARRGLCRLKPDGEEESLAALFEEILRTVPPPTHDPEAAFQLQVCGLEYDDFLGRLAIGRITSGEIKAGQEIVHVKPDGSTAKGTVTGLYGHEGPRRVEAALAGPGEIVCLTGVEHVSIGATLCDPARPEPLGPLKLDEPTLAVELAVNASPMAGLEGRVRHRCPPARTPVRGDPG